MEGLQTIIEMRCCVCGRFLGIKDGRGVSGVSHGFCDGCFKEFWKSVREEDKKIPQTYKNLGLGATEA